MNHTLSGIAKLDAALQTFIPNFIFCAQKSYSTQRVLGLLAIPQAPACACYKITLLIRDFVIATNFEILLGYNLCSAFYGLVSKESKETTAWPIKYV